MSNRMPITSIRPLQRRLIEQLRNRLVFIILLLVGCILLSAAAGFFSVINQQQFGEQKLSIHNDVNSLLQAMIDQETGLRGYVTTNDTSFLDPYNTGRTQYNTALQSLKDATAGPNFRTTASAIAVMDEQAANWSNTFGDLQITDMQTGKFDMARSVQTNVQGKVLFDAFRRSVSQLQQAADSDLSSLQSTWTIVDYTSLGLAGVLTIIAIFWLWNTFTSFAATQRTQLDILKQTAAAFGAGDLSVRVQNVTDADLHEVGHTFNIMATTLQDQQNALRDRDILEHVSQLNGILTASLDLAELMNSFLDTTLPLLDIQISALYLYAPETNNLHLFASRGIHADELQPEFALGEGLIGRTASKLQPLMVTDSRRDNAAAFGVKTALGKVFPSSLYHLPLQRGRDLLGVLVVGSIYPMREQTRNVFNVIASDVASAISNTRAYGHIQEQARELTELARDQEQANNELRQQRDELAVLNSALEEANRARSRFLSTMSHELRTPLTSIIGFGQMLLRSSSNKASLTERQINNIDRILKNAQHLLTLINDVLDLAKVESGRMDINATEVDLRELLNSVVEETRSVAVSRGLTVSVNVSDEVQDLETDPLKLRQIILNLLSNALKFTESGNITISAMHRIAPMSSERGAVEGEQVAIAVKDNGIGIPPEQQARIFEAFYQVDNSNSRNYGGTGLGLSIVREFTTLLGGKVEIESEVGQGTTFTILLPLHAYDRQSLQEIRLNTLHGQLYTSNRNEPRRSITDVVIAASEPSASSDELLVIAIDDNPDVLHLIAASLEQTPYRVVGIQDSTQAVALVQELRPNVVTLDIMMPKMNGWQILHQLKSNPATAAIPVILLTVLEDRSAGYVLGADEYLVKPVARDALLATLHQLTANQFNGNFASIVTPSSVTSTDNEQGQGEMGTPLKPILLIHKEPDVHRLIDRLVKETGYSIKTTEDGQDVMQMIEQSLPDMLMLLVQMEKQSEEDTANSLTVDSLPESFETSSSSQEPGHQVSRPNLTQ